jgi:hypothetical protein
MVGQVNLNLHCFELEKRMSIINPISHSSQANEEMAVAVHLFTNNSGDNASQAKYIIELDHILVTKTANRATGS